jgi:hypothetical protein
MKAAADPNNPPQAAQESGLPSKRQLSLYQNRVQGEESKNSQSSSSSSSDAEQMEEESSESQDPSSKQADLPHH